MKRPQTSWGYKKKHVTYDITNKNETPAILYGTKRSMLLINGFHNYLKDVRNIPRHVPKR